MKVRDVRREGDRLVLAGVANAMPCTVEIGGRESWRLLGRMLRPAVLAFMLKAIFAKPAE